MVDYYVRMVAGWAGHRPVPLVWSNKHKVWRTEARAEALGFRDVDRMTHEEAFSLLDEMRETGFFGDDDAGDIELCIGFHSNRYIYVLFGWDEEEGRTEPIAKVRALSWGEAWKEFERNYKLKSQWQMAHISEKGCQDDKTWEEISWLELQSDLVG